MTVALIQMDRHIFYPGIFIFLIHSGYALSKRTYRIVGSRCEKHRKRLRNPVHASLPHQNLHTGKHLIIGSQCKCVGTQRILYIFIPFLLVGRDPFLRCLARFEFLIESSEAQIIHKCASVFPSFERCDDPADNSSGTERKRALVSGPHNNGSRKSACIHRQILPQQERSHTVPEHKIRHIRIFLFRHLLQLVNIPYHILIAFAFIKISQISFRLYGFSMSQMIMPNHIISVPAHKFCELIITVNVLHHSMADL